MFYRHRLDITNGTGECMNTMILTPQTVIYLDSALIPSELLLDARNGDHVAVKMISPKAFDSLLAYSTQAFKYAAAYASKDITTDSILLKALSQYLGLTIEESVVATYLDDLHVYTTAILPSGRVAAVSIKVMLTDGSRILHGIDLTQENIFMVANFNGSVPLAVTREVNLELPKDLGEASGFEMFGDVVVISNLNKVENLKGKISIFRNEDQTEYYAQVAEIHIQPDRSKSVLNASPLGQLAMQLLSSNTIDPLIIYGERRIDFSTLDDLATNLHGQMGVSRLNEIDYLKDWLLELLTIFPQNREYEVGIAPSETLLLSKISSNRYEILNRFTLEGSASDADFPGRVMILPDSLKRGVDENSLLTLNNRFATTQNQILDLMARREAIDMHFLNTQFALALRDVENAKNVIGSSTYFKNFYALFPNLSLDALLSAFSLPVVPFAIDSRVKKHKSQYALADFLSVSRLMDEATKDFSVARVSLDLAFGQMRQKVLDATLESKDIQREVDYRGTKPHKTVDDVHESEFTNLGSIHPLIQSSDALSGLLKNIKVVDRETSPILVVSLVEDACGTVWVPEKVYPIKYSTFDEFAGSLGNVIRIWLTKSLNSMDVVFAQALRDAFLNWEEKVAQVLIVEVKIFEFDQLSRQLDSLMQDLAVLEGKLRIASSDNVTNSLPVKMLEDIENVKMNQKYLQTSMTEPEQVAGALPLDKRPMRYRYNPLLNHSKHLDPEVVDSHGKPMMEDERVLNSTVINKALLLSSQKVKKFMDENKVLSFAVRNENVLTPAQLPYNDPRIDLRFDSEEGSALKERISFSLSGWTVEPFHYSQGANWPGDWLPGTIHTFMAKTDKYLNYYGSPFVDGAHFSFHYGFMSSVGGDHWSARGYRHHNLYTNYGNYLPAIAGWSWSTGWSGRTRSASMYWSRNPGVSYGQTSSKPTTTNVTIQVCVLNANRTVRSTTTKVVGSSLGRFSCNISVEGKFSGRPEIRVEKITTHWVKIFVTPSNAAGAFTLKDAWSGFPVFESFNVSFSLRKLSAHPKNYAAIINANAVSIDIGSRGDLKLYELHRKTWIGSNGLAKTLCSRIGKFVQVALSPGQLNLTDGSVATLRKLPTPVSLVYVIDKIKADISNEWNIPKAYRIGDRLFTEAQINSLKIKVAALKVPSFLLDVLTGDTGSSMALPTSTHLGDDLTIKMGNKEQDVTAADIATVTYASQHYKPSLPAVSLARRHAIKHSFGSSYKPPQD